MELKLSLIPISPGLQVSNNCNLIVECGNDGYALYLLHAGDWPSLVPLLTEQVSVPSLGQFSICRTIFNSHYMCCVCVYVCIVCTVVHVLLYDALHYNIKIYFCLAQW